MTPISPLGLNTLGDADLIALEEALLRSFNSAADNGRSATMLQEIRRLRAERRRPHPKP